MSVNTKNRKYILLTLSIFGINGSVQYLYNKVMTLRGLGYEVFLFSGNNGKIIESLSKIYVTQLSEYKDLILSELQYPPMMFTKKKTEKIVNHIVDMVGDLEAEFYIEANSIATAEWGELLSSRLKAPCFWFDLQESYNYSTSEKEYVRYKLANHAIAGIAPESISHMLDEESFTSICFKAYCSNSVQDVIFNIPKFVQEANIRIGIIGRLNKPYVYPILQSVKNYIMDHDNMIFSVVLIGGAPRQDILQIESIFQEIKNVKLYITDYIYPIPRTLIKCVNLFISTSGSAMASMREGVPTIVVDASTNLPIGVLDYTIDNDMYGNATYELDKLMNDILFGGFCENHSKLGMQEQFEIYDYRKDVQTQIEYIKNINHIPYQVNGIIPSRKYYRIMSFFVRIFGISFLDMIRNQVHARSKE